MQLLYRTPDHEIASQLLNERVEDEPETFAFLDQCLTSWLTELQTTARRKQQEISERNSRSSSEYFGFLHPVLLCEMSKSADDIRRAHAEEIAAKKRRFAVSLLFFHLLIGLWFLSFSFLFSGSKNCREKKERLRRAKVTHFLSVCFER